MSYHYLGDITDAGASPYQIKGDPVTALIAQLNRFAGRTLSPGGKCGSRKYLSAALPLATVLSDQAATAANILMYDRLSCLTDERLIDQNQLAKVMAGTGNPIPWAMSNLQSITIQIAQLGDSLGLSPASVGITAVDPKLKPKFPMTAAIVIGGVLLVGAIVVARSRS